LFVYYDIDEIGNATFEKICEFLVDVF